MSQGDLSCCSTANRLRSVARWLPIAAFVLMAFTLAHPAWAQIDPPPGSCTPGTLDGVCPSDGNPCTDEICDAATHTCTSVPKSCGIDSACSVGSCDPATGQCIQTPKSCASDGLCSTGSCDPATGQCVQIPKSCANDGLCSVGSCDAATGACVQKPITCQADDNHCTTEFCNPANGLCESTAPKTCAGDGLCSTGSCDPATGNCVQTPKSCSDDSKCSTGSCDPATGQCTQTPKVCANDGLCSTGSCDAASGNCVQTPKSCAQDGNKCTVEACNPANGQCESGAPKFCANDGLCNTGSCDTATGNCKQTPVTCQQDSDNCTTEVCDTTTGQCHSVATNPPPTNCGAAICRTPGFWGTHAGTEKSGSQNITQAVITLGGGVLNVCGQAITNTVLNDDDSAVEGICVNVKDGSIFQLARQLTAAALNCVVSDGVPDCSQTPLFQTLFASCNATCASSSATSSQLTSCINQLNCLNNGGALNASGKCGAGICGDGVTSCTVGSICADGSECGGIDAGNCHQQLLVNSGLGINFEPPGGAGSSTECNNAIKNACKVVTSAQSKCLF